MQSVGAMIPHFVPRVTLAAVIALCGFVSGCSTFGLGKRGDDLASIDDIKGPTERRLQQVSYETSADIASRETDPALVAAKALFDEGRFEESEKAYKTIHERYRPDSFKRNFASRRALTGKKTEDEKAIEAYGSPIEQECLFMLAECQFFRNDFKEAEVSYGRLLRRYPATRHINTVSNRTYTIARHWLGFPPAKVSAGPAGDASDIQQIVFTDVQQSSDPAVAPDSSGWLNLTDKTKPTFDTTGRALNALKSIWLNDPTGPLADDALILTANYHYRNDDPVEAARYYELLREQYPDSPHLKNAYLLESHVKLISYAGERYDDTSLEEAAKLKQASLQMFPDLATDQQQQLTRELAQIEDAMVAREWSLVELYRQKDRSAAVRLHCNAIINQYPDSRYAARARSMLEMLADEERSGKRNLWPFGQRPIPPLPPSFDGATGMASLETKPPRITTAVAEVTPTRVQPADTPTSAVVPAWAGESPKSRSPIVQVSASEAAQTKAAAVNANENPFAEFMQVK